MASRLLCAGIALWLASAARAAPGEEPAPSPGGPPAGAEAAGPPMVLNAKGELVPAKAPPAPAPPPVPAPAAPPPTAQPAAPPAPPPPKPRPARTGWEAALTFGPWFPGGSASGAQGDALQDWFGTTWLMGFEAGYRFVDMLSLRGYLQSNVVDALAPVGSRTGSQCRAAGLRCHASVFRMGGDLRLHAPPWHVDFWGGVGLGTERSSVTRSWSETILYGDEWLLELGADRGRYGLSCTYAWGKYTARDVGAGHQALAAKAGHRWLGLAARLAF